MPRVPTLLRDGRLPRRGPFALLASGALAAVYLSSAVLARPPKEPQRPRIVRIGSVTIIASDIPETRQFYLKVPFFAHACNWCENESIPSAAISLASGQIIKLEKLPQSAPSSLLQEITFETDDLDRLSTFLKVRHVDFQQEKDHGHLLRISLLDPEGHRIAFLPTVELGPLILGRKQLSTPNFIGSRIIHAGFVVHDRAAMDHFYKDILGFRLYWQGGMKDGETDWVDMQVPDGTDWIEYMLNVPANADKRELGVMNHIALGVPDIHAAEQQLLKNGMKLAEKPQIGRDGKRQLNLYDPDGTRVEFMEFTPVEKPCCSDYTGPHPKP